MPGVLQHELFRFKLRLAVEVDRDRLVFFPVPTSPPVKHFAARQEDKWDIFGKAGQVSRGVHIDAIERAQGLARSPWFGSSPHSG